MSSFVPPSSWSSTPASSVADFNSTFYINNQWRQYTTSQSITDLQTQIVSNAIAIFISNDLKTVWSISKRDGYTIHGPVAIQINSDAFNQISGTGTLYYDPNSVIVTLSQLPTFPGSIPCISTWNKLTVNNSNEYIATSDITQFTKYVYIKPIGYTIENICNLLQNTQSACAISVNNDMTICRIFTSNNVNNNFNFTVKSGNVDTNNTVYPISFFYLTPSSSASSSASASSVPWTFTGFISQQKVWIPLVIFLILLIIGVVVAIK